jgi:hypothetical protein
MSTTIREFIRKYEGGAFNDKSFETMRAAGWYDWFCRKSSLKRRLDKLYPKVVEVSRSKKINIDTMYVFFQNCCPGEGSLYDEFRICNMGTCDVIYVVVPKSGHACDNGRAELWGRENEFNGPLVAGTWKNIKAYFGIGGAA